MVFVTAAILMTLSACTTTATKSSAPSALRELQQPRGWNRYKDERVVFNKLGRHTATFTVAATRRSERVLLACAGHASIVASMTSGNATWGWSGGCEPVPKIWSIQPTTDVFGAAFTPSSPGAVVRISLSEGAAWWRVELLSGPQYQPVGAVLQVRRVLRSTLSCPGWAEEPPANEATAVTVQGQGLPACFLVGVADVSLQGMKAGAEDTALGWVVDVTLDSTESKAFNEMAARDDHRTVTFLVNGIAIGEATVQVRNFGASFEFGPALMNKATAKYLAHELDPGP
jgi:hypothetical protein